MRRGPPGLNPAAEVAHLPGGTVAAAFPATGASVTFVLGSSEEAVREAMDALEHG